MNNLKLSRLTTTQKLQTLTMSYYQQTPEGKDPQLWNLNQHRSNSFNKKYEKLVQQNTNNKTVNNEKVIY